MTCTELSGHWRLFVLVSFFNFFCFWLPLSVLDYTLDFWVDVKLYRIV